MISDIGSVITSCVIDLDSRVRRSYNGQDGLWRNLCVNPADGSAQSDYNIMLTDGKTERIGEVNTSDCRLSIIDSGGEVGSITVNTNFINALHKTSVQQPFSVGFYMNYKASGDSASIFSTMSKPSYRFSAIPEVQPDITFVRNTTAIRVNSEGLLDSVGANIIRHQYAASNGEYLGWLIERQKQNIFANSNDLSVTITGGWITTPAVTLTQGAKDPFGGNTGWVIERNLATGGGYVYKSGVPFTSGTQYVFSKYYDPSNCSDISDNFSLPAAAFGTANIAFNPTTRVFSNIGADVQNYGISEELDNGCFRVFIVATATTTVASNMIVHNVPTLTVGLKMAASCFQLEVGNYPSAYIPTEASAVTRASDQPSYTLPEAVTEGTLYFEGMSLDPAPSSLNFGFFFSLSDGSTANYVAIRKNTEGRTLIRCASGGVSYDSSQVTIPINTLFRAALSFKNGQLFGSINGVPVTFASMPSTINPMSILRIGSYGNGANVNNGMVCADSFYHVRPLSAAQCQAITEMPNV